MQQHHSSFDQTFQWIKDWLDTDSAPVESLEFALKSLHAADIADIIEDLNASDREKLILSVSHLIQSDVLRHLASNIIQDILVLLGTEHFQNSFLTLSNEDAFELIEKLSDELRDIFLNFLPVRRRKIIQLFFAYDENAIGRYMSVDFMQLPQKTTVEQALSEIRSHADELPDNFSEIFVIDEQGKPLGLVFTKDLISASGWESIDKFIQKGLVPINANLDKEDASLNFNKYDTLRAPVVNDQGSIVGILRSDDILEIMSENVSSGILNVGGLSSEEEGASFLESLKGRLPWIFMSLIYASFSPMIIRCFRGLIEQVSILAVLMPLVASIGGVLGIQSISMVMKDFAEGLRQQSFCRTILKESVLGLIEGAIIGIFVGITIFFMFSNFKLGCVVSLAMVFNMTWAAFSGSSLPIICTKLGIDSAVCSGPIITTLTDVAGYVIFLSLAQWIL